MSDRPTALDRGVAMAVGVACLLLCAYFATHARDESHLRTANDLGVKGEYRRALAEARRVDRAPARGRALIVQAAAAQALGRHRDAIELYRQAEERNPRSWSLHRDWAISLLALGRPRSAARHIDVAGTLNPRMPLPPGFAGPAPK